MKKLSLLISVFWQFFYKMTFFKNFWQNTSKYHLHKFRNYFKEWVLTENLTIEGSTELKDFLLSDIIYPTVQKWFYSKCRRIQVWIPPSSRHEKRCQMLQSLFWLFQYSKNPRCSTSTVNCLFHFESIMYV